MALTTNFGIVAVTNSKNEVSYLFVNENTYSEIPSEFTKEIIFEHEEVLVVVKEFKKYNNPTNILKY